MALVVFTSEDLFDSFDPDIAGIVDGVSITLYHELDKIAGVLDQYFIYNQYNYMIIATSYNEEPVRYQTIKKYLQDISLRKKIPLYVVVNMGYFKNEKPNQFGSTDIYYFPSNTLNRDKKIKRIISNLSLLGRPDIAKEMQNLMDATLSADVSKNGYMSLKNTLTDIRDKFDRHRNEKNISRFSKHDGRHFSFSSPL